MIALVFWRVLAFFLARYELIRAPDGTPYLSRWHFPAWVVAAHNAIMIAGAEYLFLHCFHQSDPDRGWHNHPYLWCEARPLRGAYVQSIREDARGEHARTVMRVCRPGTVNFLRDEYHAVYLLYTPTWTLFRAGMKHGRSWGFVDAAGAYRAANGDRS